MDPILDKARGGQNFLEKIMNAIPGFKGYREKELRRDADKLQRDHLAGRLDENKKALSEAAAGATRSGNLDVINDIETARKKLDKVANRIRWADRGYAGFFDTVKVDEAVLGRVYEFDMRLLESVDTIQGLSAGLGQSPDPKASVQSLVAELDALDTRLNDRESILSGVK